MNEPIKAGSDNQPQQSHIGEILGPVFVDFGPMVAGISLNLAVRTFLPGLDPQALPKFTAAAFHGVGCVLNVVHGLLVARDEGNVGYASPQALLAVLNLALVAVNLTAGPMA